MTRIAYVSNDDGLAALFQAARLAPNRLTDDEARTLVRTAESPVVLVLDGRRQQRLVHWAQGFLGGKSTVAVLLLVKALDYTSVPDAMQAGVRDCLPEPLTAAALDRAVRRVVDLVEAEGRQGTGQVVAFVGAKGGVGTTTLAANTATSVARLGGVATLLVDLHLTGGDVALFMGTQTRVSVLDALENLHQLDNAALWGLMEKSAGGVHVLGSSSRPTPVAIPAATIQAFLDSAARRYRLTVLDVPRRDAAAIEALDRATTIVLVTGQELSSVRAAAAAASALRQRFGSRRLRVVINRYDKNATVSAQDVAMVIGEPVAWTFPNDYRVAVEAINTGRPFTLQDGRLSKAIQQVAAELTHTTGSSTGPVASMLARLSWRRV